MPFAQFAVDPKTVFKVMDELTIPADQLKAFQENRDGCVIGRKLAAGQEAHCRAASCRLKGRRLPGGPGSDGPGIYDGPSNRDLRMCLVRFDYFDELFKRVLASSSRPRPAQRDARATRA